jgi:redox-sensitive bicupin YhaK (pirin superfamily)
MIKIIPSKDRHFNDFGWLKTYWLFSFADYFDPENIQFGALRVFNDDIVEPGQGFGTHPHKEMEIVTIVFHGEVTHEDSMGNKAVIKTGDVQRMSAGTGITHSEFNFGSEPAHFCQIWILPDVPKLNPSYEQKKFSFEANGNGLLPLVSGNGMPETVSIHSDVTFYRGTLKPGGNLNYPMRENRRVFVYVTDGTMEVQGNPLHTNDQARIDLEENLQLTGTNPTEFLLIDVPSCKGWGYDEETLKGAKK